MDKQWLIKINGEDNLYYDSYNKEYRLRLLCPHCHKPSGCWCYEDYEDYEIDISSKPEMYCTYRCTLMINRDSEGKHIIKAAQDLGIGIKQIDEYTEKEAEQILDHLFDECIWDFSEDFAGEQCDT